MRATKIFLPLLLTLHGTAVQAQLPGSDLPDIGTPASTTLSLADEYKIGLMIVRSLRDAGQIVEDPEINEYLQTLGMSLASNAHEGAHRFTFFAVGDSGINAFALPGGFIGVNAGLVTATRNESELAGVLAHGHRQVRREGSGRISRPERGRGVCGQKPCHRAPEGRNPSVDADDIVPPDFSGRA